MKNIHYDEAVVPEDLAQIHWATLGQMACFYYDACIAIDLYKTWEKPLVQLLGYLCEGDLPRFLANTHRFILAREAMLSESTQADERALSELHRIACILADPLAQAWALADANASMQAVHDMFGQIQDNMPVKIQQADVLALYDWLARYQENALYLNSQDQYATKKTLGFALPKLHTDQLKNPKGILALIDNILDESAVVTHQKVDKASLRRKYFIAIYEQEKVVLLSCQLHSLYDRQKHHLIDMMGKLHHYQSRNCFQTRATHPKSLTDMEAANECFEYSDEGEQMPEASLSVDQVPKQHTAQQVILCVGQQGLFSPDNTTIQILPAHRVASNEQGGVFDEGSSSQIT